MKIKLTCPTCNKQFERHPSYIKRSLKYNVKNFYCSNPCRHKSYVPKPKREIGFSISSQELYNKMCENTKNNQLEGVDNPFVD